jgi:Fe-S oxidoreductase
MPAQDRMAWSEGLNIRVLSPGDSVDVLFFVGCAGSFDDRNIKVSRAFVEILTKLKVDFGVLGNAEVCCGETARRMGNEYLFQMSAEGNISAFSEISFNKIVTLCPHGLNTLKNEYPRFGGKYQVLHAAEYLAATINNQNLDSGKADQFGRVTFHDSCYLGRYNNVYAQPRELLRNASINPLEMKSSKEKSFCCGGGGGAMWLETAADTRINQNRLNHALDIQADTITTACPYCLIMFDDALRSKGLIEEVQVLDIIEILNQSI